MTYPTRAHSASNPPYDAYLAKQRPSEKSSLKSAFARMSSMVTLKQTNSYRHLDELVPSNGLEETANDLLETSISLLEHTAADEIVCSL